MYSPGVLHDGPAHATFDCSFARRSAIERVSTGMIGHTEMAQGEPVATFGRKVETMLPQFYDVEYQKVLLSVEP